MLSAQTSWALGRETFWALGRVRADLARETVLGTWEGEGSAVFRRRPYLVAPTTRGEHVLAFGKKKDRFLESRHLGVRGFCRGTVRALGRERLLLVAPTTVLKGHVLAFG